MFISSAVRVESQLDWKVNKTLVPSIIATGYLYA